MREIKFRSWNARLQLFVYFKNGIYSFHEFCAPKHKCSENLFDWMTAKQYTESKDCAGENKIFDGDIVKTTKGVFEIKWNEDVFAFMVWHGRETNKSFQMTCDNIIDYQIKIIGNIHENLELLE